MTHSRLQIMGWITGFILLFISATTAQSVDSCYAKAPAEVGIGQTFKYTVTTSEKGEVISSDFGKFELVNGPNIGTSTSISMVNGHIDQSTQYTYTYYLSCEKEGEFSIPGVTFSFDGRLVKSNIVIVRVVKTPKSQPQEEQADSWFHFEMPEMPSFDQFGFNWPFGNRNDAQSDNDNRNSKREKVQVEEKIGKDDVFVKASTTKMEAFQGEAIVVTHKLYLKSGLNRYSIQRAVFAPTEDFWMNSLELSQREHSTETINGKEYEVYTIKQTAVYPTRTGKLTIPKMDLSLVIRIPANVKDPFWGIISSYQNKDVKLSANELTVKVKPMPGVNSENKTEVVGNFSITSNISKMEARTNEPIVLTITVSGNGNLHHIEANDFNIDFPADFDVTYPKVSAHISAKGDIITGSKTFRYTIRPREEGSFLLPGATYTYYDYDSGSYKTITTQDYKIEVKPGLFPSQTPSDNNDELEKKSKPAKTYKI